MNETLILHNNVAEIRKQQQMSQAELANLIGVSRNTISSIETGQYQPTAKLALLICIALNKKFEQIFYFQQNNRKMTLTSNKNEFLLLDKSKKVLTSKTYRYKTSSREKGKTTAMQ